MSHVVNSHILTGPNACFNKANGMLLIRGFCYFICKHSGAVTKSDVIRGKGHSRKSNFRDFKMMSFALGEVFLKHLQEAF